VAELGDTFSWIGTLQQGGPFDSDDELEHLRDACFMRRSGHIAAQTYMLAQMQNSANNVNQILAINVRSIFHISDYSNHEGKTTTRQKINMRNDCVTYINWKAGTSHAKAVGDREYVHKSLQNRRILSKEIVARKVGCRGSPTLTPTIAEVR
jgi:hypothetical protein